MTKPELPPAVKEQLQAAEMDRQRDRGHYNQYGMRDDTRAERGDHANPGTGDHARRFGASGDLSTYANRDGGQEDTVLQDTSSDAPASDAAP